MKRLRNVTIVNKIIKSNQFKNYLRYLLQNCFAQALELEGEFQVGEVISPNFSQATILMVEGEGMSQDTINETWANPG